MTKKQRALEIIDRLKKEYPDADCTLDYNEAWKLLVSVSPKKKMPYQTAFVFIDKMSECEVPAWAMKVELE